MDKNNNKVAQLLIVNNIPMHIALRLWSNYVGSMDVHGGIHAL